MKKIVLMFASVALIYACSEKTENQQDSNAYKATQTELPADSVNFASALLVADSITYDVLLKNPDPQDEWTEHCLRNVDIQSIADWVFEGVYSGKMQAYSYADMVPLTADQVKSFEADTANARKKIAKMQFEEKWYLDAKNQQMVKKVHAIMLAYAINPSEGRYRAGIKILLSPQTANQAPKDSILP